ncbi:MAG TPA: efflux RND transporter permease subunit [Acidobacteriaceae bacterium]|jgi:multidrug efflux pump|nr:efflux RND transporter permease subunit [Acidobacteriaceae bacterium]
MSEPLQPSNTAAPDETAAKQPVNGGFHLSAPFIRRPVATFLLSAAIILAGAVAYKLLPVASLPQVDFPVISVSASLPGADPETVASSIATPLERQFGRIAGINQMTSTSSIGSASINMQFDLNRDVNGAARDVQAAINAARTNLPANLPSNPTYRKANPSDPPIMIISLTSDTMPVPQIYDAADSILAQKLSQVLGVGQVSVAGSAKPAVRIVANPTVLNGYGLGLDTLANALANVNVNRPKGYLSDDSTRMSISTTDQLGSSATYKPLIIAYKNGAPVRVEDVADVTDSVENIETGGSANGKPAILLIIFKSPNANIIDTVDKIQALLPMLQASIPPTIKLDVVVDRTLSIRASVQEVTRTLIISIFLVILVVFIFLREVRSTLIPSVSVPLSLLGTCGVMYLLGYTIDNLSLMALTISTGFVVDDAIVVIENINRHLENGLSPFDAAMLGSKEIGFTVLSMSTSLIAVFIPILLMPGVLGRLFREFAITLSASIMISLVVSLTATPMLSAKFLEPYDKNKHGRIYMFGERMFDKLRAEYERGLRWVLRHQKTVLLINVGTILLSVYLFMIVPKGFFPQEDIGRLSGQVRGQQDVSFTEMNRKMKELSAIVQKDPAVDTVLSFLGSGPGGGAANQGSMFITLKPLNQRPKGDTADVIINRLRPKLSHEPGAQLILQAQQDLNIGGRSSAAQYQYTLSTENLADLDTWAPKLTAGMQKLPELRDVNTDMLNDGLREQLVIDRNTASRLGLTPSDIDNALYDAFGQRQVSTIYAPLNQYHVVMAVDDSFQNNPDALNQIYVRHGATGTAAANSASSAPPLLAASAAPPPDGTIRTEPAGTGAPVAADPATATPASGTTTVTTTVASTAAVDTNTTTAVAEPTSTVSSTPSVPLSAIAHFEEQRSALAVNHQGPFPAATISFNLAPGVSLSQATDAINKAQADLGMPDTINTGFQGTAQAFQSSLSSEPVLILLALVAVYIVLGMLYESFIHPLTILSTLPSAGVGALLALLLFKLDLSVIAMIGILLLIGIVKKNAIMMIDFALVAEREHGKSPEEAIYEACLLRFRPIMMTTMAAMLGGVPLAISNSMGSELRKPLGVTIVGGLMVSQMLTLFTTPVVYLFADRARLWLRETFGLSGPANMRNRPPHISPPELQGAAAGD